MLLREARRIEGRFLAARDLVAAELRANARVLENAWSKTPPPPAPRMALLMSAPHWHEVRGEIAFRSWQGHVNDLLFMRRLHEDLWRELIHTYEMLQASLVEDSPRLHSDELFSLAARLEDAEL
jgi:hypothetical protein